MKILIDNGYGRETPGKRSPDGRLIGRLNLPNVRNRHTGLMPQAF